MGCCNWSPLVTLADLFYINRSKSLYIFTRYFADRKFNVIATYNLVGLVYLLLFNAYVYYNGSMTLVDDVLSE